MYNVHMMNTNFAHDIGKTNGHFKNKENRAQKLLIMWNDIEKNMIETIQSGYAEQSLEYRCAYGILLMMHTGIRVGNEGSAEGYVPVRTEFVKIDGEFVPVKKFNKETKEYLPVPEYAHIKKRYIRHEGKWELSSDIPNPPVQTFGLTTLLSKHVGISKNAICLNFIGKKRVEQNFCLTNKILAKYVPPQSEERNGLFLHITYKDLRRFVHRNIGRKFTMKDIRTTIVNKLFQENLRVNIIKLRNGSKEVYFTKKREMNAFLRESIQQTADQIGHTRGVCKSAYITHYYMAKVKEDLELMLEYGKQKAKEEKERKK